MAKQDNTMWWVLGGLAALYFYNKSKEPAAPAAPGDLAVAQPGRNDAPPAAPGAPGVGSVPANFAFENSLFYGQQKKFDSLSA